MPQPSFNPLQVSIWRGDGYLGSRSEEVKSWSLHSVLRLTDTRVVWAALNLFLWHSVGGLSENGLSWLCKELLTELVRLIWCKAWLLEGRTKKIVIEAASSTWQSSSSSRQRPAPEGRPPLSQVAPRPRPTLPPSQDRWWWWMVDGNLHHCWWHHHCHDHHDSSSIRSNSVLQLPPPRLSQPSPSAIPRHCQEVISFFQNLYQCWNDIPNTICTILNHNFLGCSLCSQREDGLPQ